MFTELDSAPPDAILGLNEAFGRDESPDKINLTIGVFRDASGRTPILECVKEAERRLVESETTKGYLGIDGMPEFGEHAQRLLFGAGHEIIESGRAVTAQTPAGTAALRVAAEFLHEAFPSARIWCSRPTWPNHPSVFAAAGIEVAEYRYFDPATNGLDLDGFLDDLAAIPAGDIVCLHACCHNPTGVDPSPDDWLRVADIVGERALLPLVDFAYQGFGSGLDEDAAGLRALCRPGTELLVASSFSKNFSLYRERVGALTVVTGDEETAAVVLSRLKRCVRSSYSNPPSHGAAVVTTILDDDLLRTGWHHELAAMRDRIRSLRTLFAKTMAATGAAGDFDFITRQQGMFSFSGLSAEQVDRLREEHSVYMVRNGRLNVAGISEQSVERLCQAIASVL